VIFHKSKFHIDIYNVEVTIIIMTSPKEVSKKALQLVKKYNFNSEIVKEAFGYTLFLGDKIPEAYIILDVNDLSVATITHEVYHLTDYIKDHVGITEEELAANLNGFLNNKIFEIIELVKLEIKKHE